MGLPQHSTDLPTRANQGATGQTAVSPRLPWLAALLSAVLPGFGQLYLARIDRAIWFFLFFTLFPVLVLMFANRWLPSVALLPAVLIGLLISLGAWFGSIFDAWRMAGRAQPFRRRAWQRPAVYALVLVFVCGIVLPLVIQRLQGQHVQAFHIPSSSMRPTLLAGDYLFADKNYNCPSCQRQVSRGDVAIFVYPNNRNQYHVKRVIGLPGDRVEIDERGVHVNGDDLHSVIDGADLESIDERRWSVVPLRGAIDPVDVIVPSGQVYVLGDNRMESLDSRDYGALPLVDIVGKAAQIWFSRSDEGVRWSRIATLVQ